MSEPEPVLSRLAADVENAKEHLRQALAPGAEWRCPHCGRVDAEPRRDDGWFDIRRLRAEVGQRSGENSSVVNIALMEMVEDGYLERHYCTFDVRPWCRLMPSRRERAIERAYDRDPINRESFDALPWDELLLESYEIELAADLESEEMVRRIVDEFLGCASFDRVVKISKIDESMRAALKAVLEER